jgi:hypothetical protein
MVVYLFQAHPSKSSMLYFFDLVGAGLGAFAFFILIERLQVLRSIVLLSLILVGHAFVLLPKRIDRSLSQWAIILPPEPVDTSSTRRLGVPATSRLSTAFHFPLAPHGQDRCFGFSATSSRDVAQAGNVPSGPICRCRLRHGNLQ